MLGIQIETPDGFLNIDEGAINKIALPASARIIRDAIRSHTPIASGKTYDETIDEKETNNSYIIHGKTSRTQKIIKFLHGGTKRHLILPVNKLALSFKVGGVNIVRKFAMHPGTKALKHFKVWPEALSKIQTVLKELKIFK
jgi:hypothetical protein